MIHGLKFLSDPKVTMTQTDLKNNKVFTIGEIKFSDENRICFSKPWLMPRIQETMRHPRSGAQIFAAFGQFV